MNKPKSTATDLVKMMHDIYHPENPDNPKYEEHVRRIISRPTSFSQSVQPDKVMLFRALCFRTSMDPVKRANLCHVDEFMLRFIDEQLYAATPENICGASLGLTDKWYVTSV